MAQAIVVQQDALAKAQTRIQELERQLEERPSGGFLSGLFGGGQETAMRLGGATGHVDRGRYHQAGAGGFLGGAMQTALGVAGGFLIADALTGLLSADEAAAAPVESDTAADARATEDQRFPGHDSDWTNTTAAISIPAAASASSDAVVAGSPPEPLFLWHLGNIGIDFVASPQHSNCRRVPVSAILRQLLAHNR